MIGRLARPEAIHREMFDDESLPHAARLGPTYRGWECVKCGLVTEEDDVVVMDDGTAWHANMSGCHANCTPVELLVRDPRQWANEASTKMNVLAREVLRLREALADIADTQTTPQGYRRMAKRALFGPTTPVTIHSHPRGTPSDPPKD